MKRYRILLLLPAFLAFANTLWRSNLHALVLHNHEEFHCREKHEKHFHEQNEDDCEICEMLTVEPQLPATPEKFHFVVSHSRYLVRWVNPERGKQFSLSLLRGPPGKEIPA